VAGPGLALTGDDDPYHGLIVNERGREHKPTGLIEAPRHSYAEALERATRTVERFHALYLRALREMRRLPRWSSGRPGR
jgi:hypothetical protein